MMHRKSGSQAAGQGNVKQVQEALKDKGFDPGAIDGVMGQKTQEALKSFQQSKNLKVTGRLDSETAQQLGVSGSASGMSSSPSSSSSAGSSSTSPRSNMGKSPGAPSSSSNTGTADSPSSDTSQMPGGSTRGSNTGSGH
jgi:peptidoglycan hydrolase-like protein with peptidoglycan-binding domain